MDVKKIPRKGNQTPPTPPSLPPKEEKKDENIIKKPKKSRKTIDFDLIPVDNNAELISMLSEFGKMKDIIAKMLERMAQLETQVQTKTLPDHMVIMLKSVLEGELKRCQHGKWPAKVQNVKAIASYFGIKI